MRPNIVFYFSDQQRWDTVNEEVMPFLNEFKSDGVEFLENFTCQPVCGPARACLQTGVYATQNGSFKNAVALDKNIKPLAEYFNEAGYDTAYVGKWHLASDNKKRVHVERKPVPEELRGGYKHWMAADVLEFTSTGHGGGYVYDTDGNRVDFSGYRADAIGGFAVDYVLNHESDKPFFLFVSQLEPHHQNNHHAFEGPEKYRKQFENYPPPSDLTFLKGDYEKSYPNYLAAIRSLDDNFRRLVDALAETGRLENTVVFYTSDHGCHFKTRNLEYKRSPHDASIHTPLIIWGGAFRGGKTADYPTSLIDLPATLLDVAGIEVPKSFAGKSLLKVQKGEDKPREAVFVQVSEAQTARAVRTSRYTYSVRSLNPPYISGRMGAKVYFEDYLYDNEADPDQKRNLVKDKNYADVRKQLKALLLKEMKKAGEAEPKILPAVIVRKK